MPDSIHKGGCACGGVRFEARGAPYRVGLCHCLTCRKAHGTFNFFAVFPTGDVTVTGDAIEFASSEQAQRYSCRSCGAPVHSTYGRDDEIGLFLPSYELWTIRREPWLPEFLSVVSRYVQSRPKWKRTEP